MSQKAKLTKRTVDAAKPPKGSQAFDIVWDTEIPGFGLRITKAGIKAYILQYRIHGRSILGIDSLGVMEVVADIEDKFDMTIADAELRDVATLGDVVKAIEGRLRADGRLQG